MSDRRLFSNKITESDAFLDMPLSTQALYFHLCLNADDDGVIDSPKRVMRMVNAQPDDLNILVTKRFVLQLSQTVIVIKHWLVHNTLMKDRYKPTRYGELMSKLFVKQNGVYTDDPDTGDASWKPKFGKPLSVCKQSDNELLSNCEQNGNISQVKSSQVKLSKDNILSSASLIDRLSEDDFKKLMLHCTDEMALLDRIDEIDGSNITHVYSYCLKVAKEMGLYKP